MGIEAAPSEVITSANATAALLHREGATGTAFVIGERGIRDALAGIGIRVVDGTPERADLVVVGWDRDLTYDRLRTAALLIQRGARLVATNADATYPAPDGLWPGGGAILAAVTTATGATPTVVGKPSRPMFEAAAEDTGARHPLVVGDRLDTDIAGAAAMGWDSLLVLTGASRLEDLPASPALPTFVAGGLTALLETRPPAGARAARRRRPAGARGRAVGERPGPAGRRGRRSAGMITGAWPNATRRLRHQPAHVMSGGGAGGRRRNPRRPGRSGRGGAGRFRNPSFGKNSSAISAPNAKPPMCAKYATPPPAFAWRAIDPNPL